MSSDINRRVQNQRDADDREREKARRRNTVVRPSPHPPVKQEWNAPEYEDLIYFYKSLTTPSNDHLIVHRLYELYLYYLNIPYNRNTMPKFDESTVVGASRAEVWDLLQSLPEMAHGLMGVEEVTLWPDDRPMEVGSRLHITTNALSKVVVAHIVGLDNEAYEIRSQVSGSGVSGDIDTKLHYVDMGQSILAVNGELHGNLFTHSVLSLGIAIFHHKGMRHIGNTLEDHARAKRELRGT